MEITRDNTMLMTSPTSSHLMLKVGLSPSNKIFFLFRGKEFRNDEKCFLFYLKSSFRSQDI